MKTVYALLVCLVFMVTGALAQPQQSANSSDSKSDAAKAVKKAKSSKKNRKDQKEAAGQKENETLPPLISERLKTVQPNGGLGDPGGLAHQEFMHRAYPDTTIPIERIAGARSAHAAISSRALSKSTLSQWQSYGPSLALYPFTPLRNFTNYIPNAYPAASRTTSLALSPNCTETNCTLWIGPAGGGVWRTDDPFDNPPKWTYLSSVFQINSIGSRELDPNDPSGQTIYAGTERPMLAAAVAKRGSAFTNPPMAAAPPGQDRLGNRHSTRAPSGRLQ